jgi:hypothetical protein
VSFVVYVNTFTAETVIPARAGTQSGPFALLKRSIKLQRWFSVWVPAFAGMTGLGRDVGSHDPTGLVVRLRRMTWV